MTTGKLWEQGTATEKAVGYCYWLQAKWSGLHKAEVMRGRHTSSRGDVEKLQPLWRKASEIDNFSSRSRCNALLKSLRSNYQMLALGNLAQFVTWNCLKIGRAHV